MINDKCKYIIIDQLQFDMKYASCKSKGLCDRLLVKVFIKDNNKVISLVKDGVDDIIFDNTNNSIDLYDMDLEFLGVMDRVVISKSEYTLSFIKINDICYIEVDADDDIISKEIEDGLVISTKEEMIKYLGILS